MRCPVCGGEFTNYEHHAQIHKSVSEVLHRVDEAADRAQQDEAS